MQPISPSSSSNPSIVNKPGNVNEAELKKTDDRPANVEVDSVATRRAKTDAATLQANLEANLSTKNKPMALIYKAALEGINEALEPEMGPNAAEKIKQSGIDVSPEATADRIVNFATAFFNRYQEQNQDLTLEEQLDSFIDLVGGGVDQGFGEARSILDGLGVLEGDLESDINRTYDLVFEGFEKFRQQQLGVTETGQA